jgi:hypothetical protein
MIGKGTLKALTSLLGLGCLGAMLVSVADGPSAWAQAGTTPGTGSQGSGSQATPPSNGNMGTSTPAAVGMREELVTVPVTVEEIDKKARSVTVKAPDGEKTTINVPADVKEFDKLKKGDKIEIDYYRSLAVEVLPPGTAPSAAQAQTTTAKGPAGRMGAKQITGSAEVVSMNRASNSVTIKGADGKQRTVAVQDPGMQKRLQAIKPGDVVQLTYTEAIAAKIRPKK